jgi:hypothetical protein
MTIQSPARRIRTSGHSSGWRRRLISTKNNKTWEACGNWAFRNDGDQGDEWEDAGKLSWKYVFAFAFGKASTSVVPDPDARDADACKSGHRHIQPRGLTRDTSSCTTTFDHHVGVSRFLLLHNDKYYPRRNSFDTLLLGSRHGHEMYWVHKHELFICRRTISDAPLQSLVERSSCHLSRRLGGGEKFFGLISR